MKYAGTVLKIPISRASIVHLNFRAGSIFLLPACTVSPGHSIGLAGATRLTRSDFRLNLLLQMGYYLLIIQLKNKISAVFIISRFRKLHFINSFNFSEVLG